VSQANELNGLAGVGKSHLCDPDCGCMKCSAESMARNSALRQRAQEAAMAMEGATQEKADPLNDELQAMRSVARTLEKLPRDVQERVITWLANRQPPRYGHQELAKAAEVPWR
jgi:hypothetical protein